MPDLGALFWPKSVAVVGASPDTNALRGRLLELMLSHPYEGAVYPISRSHDTVQGLKAYPSIAEVPDQVDLAVIIIPARFVPDVLEECGAAGVKAAHIITSGFAEERGGAGAGLQARLREIASKYDMAVAGPNSEGFANTRNGLCPTFSPAVDLGDIPLYPSKTAARPIAAVAQSGGIGFAFYDYGRAKELPFAYVVSTGNEACLETLDVVEYLLAEGEVGAILLFLEEIKTPARLAPVAEQALKAGVPLIVGKIGRSDAGVRAAASHTAALAGDYAAYQAIFRRYGIIETDDISEAVDIAAGFAFCGARLPRGRRVGIFTPSGGAGGWLTEACVAGGLEVPELDDETRAAIDVHLPSYGTSVNPVDVTAQAIREIGYARLAGLVAGSDRIDAVAVVTSARSTATFERDHENLVGLAASNSKPVLFYSYTRPAPEPLRLLAEAGYPLVTSMANCARTLRAMADYGAFRERFLAKVPDLSDRHSQAGAVAETLRAGPPILTEAKARPLLAAYGMPVGEFRLAQNVDQAIAAAAEIGVPVALKLQSPDITHKSEAGGVVLGLQDGDAIRAAFVDILAKVQAHRPTAAIEGVLVTPMAPAGIEMILGVHRDPTFGPMLMAGLGGIFVEVLGDVAFAPLPVDGDAAHEMLDQLNGRALFDGMRGQPAADIDALVAVMRALSHFAADQADMIAEIDLNPVRVHPVGDGVTILDALIVLRDT